MSGAGDGPGRETAGLLLHVRSVSKHYPVSGGGLLRRPVGVVKAVDGVSFGIRKGESFGLVGESGCGKSTLAKLILRLEAATSGEILFDPDGGRSDGRPFRRRVQAVFQDPFSSLNPRMTVREIVGEPLLVHRLAPGRAARDRLAAAALDDCGLTLRLMDRYPHEMSGGQRQRVSIARAIIMRPDFIVCDEAVSALDVSIQAQIVNLLAELKREYALTYLFIGHDLGVVRHICDRVMVMYLGRVAEQAESEQLFAAPAHPYTQALMSAIPVPDPTVEQDRALLTLEGEVPSPLNPPSGCVFHPRCPRADAGCAERIPAVEAWRARHDVACFHPGPPERKEAWMS